MKKTKSKKSQLIVQAVVLVGIIILLNIIFSVYYTRIDLTADNRYTLSAPTKNMLRGLDDVVYVKVYLEGDDLPPGFRKLRDATRDMLDEFKVIAGDKIQYQFIDPEDAPDQETRKNLYKQLASEGLYPMNLEVNEEDKISQKIIIPGALVTYNNKTVPAELLQQQVGNIPPEQVLHNSATNVEYQLANSIRKLKTQTKQKVGFIQGHGELDPIYLDDIFKSLSEYYDVDYVDLPKSKPARLDGYDAIIIAKPDSTFHEVEKYKIDQFVMKGGKVLWLVETLMAEMDSLDQKGTGFTSTYPLNLEDILFKYGVRINYNLVQDLNCHFIPLVSSAYGTSQRGNLLKWPYFPVVVSTSDHPIVNNLSAVLFQFANTIDTIHSKQNADIKKTILLRSSPYTRVMLNPVRIDLQLVAGIDPQLYRQGEQNLAVLLEGSFNSVFTNRLKPEMLQSGDYGNFTEKGKPTKMIVVSDGDVIKSQVNRSRQQVYPLGYDMYTDQTFGNKTFILNCIDYLIDESGLISLRSKQFKLRLLDAGKVKEGKTSWQALNMIIPVALIIVFGIIYNYIRKRRFAH